MNKSESKYFNTAIRMDEALIELLQKKSFEYISIKELCKAADVNRSTFYLHYQNMCELLDEAIKLMHTRFLNYFGNNSKDILQKMHDCPKQELLLITPQYITPYLQYVKDNMYLYSAAINNPSNFNTHATYQTMFVKVFDPILGRFDVPDGQRHYLMSFYLGGISSLVDAWIKGGCKTPIGEITDLIVSCIPKF